MCASPVRSGASGSAKRQRSAIDSPTSSSLLTKVTAVSLAVRLPGLGLLPIGVGFGLLSFPLAYRTLRESSRVPAALLAMSVLAVTSGWFMRWYFHPSDAVAASTSQAWMLTIWLLALPVLVVSTWFCKRQLGAWRASALFGAGFLVGNVIYFESASFENSWKFAFAIPVSILVLAVIGRLGAPKLGTFLTISGLATLCFVYDYRSTGGMLLFTALLAAMPDRTREADRQRRRAVRDVIVLAAIGAVAYAVFTQAMAVGLLGDRAQQRFETQTRQGTQSLLLSARTEWRVSLRFMRDHPAGFGVAMRPSAADRVLAAQVAYGSARFDGTGYFEDRALGERVDLHSSIASMWFHFGIPGFAVGLSLLGLLAREVGAQLAQLRGPDSYRPLYLFLGLQALWDLVFSPMAGAFLTVCAIGLLLRTSAEAP